MRGLLAWLPVFKGRPHLWRLPGWASPTAGRLSGIRRLARPSAGTAPPTLNPRTGLGKCLGLRGLTASSSVLSSLWVLVEMGMQGTPANRKHPAAGERQGLPGGQGRALTSVLGTALGPSPRLMGVSFLRCPGRPWTEDQVEDMGYCCPDLSLTCKVKRPKHPRPWKAPEPS